MTMNNVLQSEISNAKTLINADGELPAQVRGKILSLIEDLSKAEHDKAGYFRRARLALICANEVITLIQPQQTVFNSAKHLLANGVLALAGKYDLKELEKENGKHHTRTIDLTQVGESAFIAMYAAMSVFSAINAVLYDTNFDVVDLSEKDVPPDDWDASFYASLAKSGSAIWENKGGAANRSEYWNWYLDIAVPLAWDVVTPIPPRG
jgi:hypothetical protein